jgi:hypothetical protein
MFTELRTKGDCMMNFANFMENATPLDIRLLNETLYQWENHAICRTPGSLVEAMGYGLQAFATEEPHPYQILQDELEGVMQLHGGLRAIFTAIRERVGKGTWVEPGRWKVDAEKGEKDQTEKTEETDEEVDFSNDTSGLYMCGLDITRNPENPHAKN